MRHKLLVLKPVLLTRANGGDISLIERLKRFQSWGVDVQIEIGVWADQRPELERVLADFGTPLSGSTYDLEGLRVHVTFGASLRADELSSLNSYEALFVPILRAVNADLVITHYTDFMATAVALKECPAKTWVDISDNEYPRLEALRNFAPLFDVYPSIQHLMVPSQFMKTVVARDFPRAQVHRLPNIIETLPSLTNRSGSFRKSGYWLHVNPAAVKGIDFTLELADKLPDERFAILGNWSSEVPKNLPKNVESFERRGSLCEILRGAKGLLVPSRWQEAFGRVPLEAMAAAVPVIASPQGGLPESVGQGGLLLPLELPLWILAIQSSTDVFWNGQIQAGLKHVEQYQAAVDQRYRALKKYWILARSRR